MLTQLEDQIKMVAAGGNGDLLGQKSDGMLFPLPTMSRLR
jgi:hypothetical protein